MDPRVKPGGDGSKWLILAAALLCIAATPPPGAASCTGCHLAGGGIGALQGRPAEDIVAEMEAFRSGARPSTVMNRIVKGFSPDEVKALAAWFAQQ
jgi:sulfide dehydrogenase cytochrome subunit